MIIMGTISVILSIIASIFGSWFTFTHDCSDKNFRFILGLLIGSGILLVWGSICLIALAKW